MQPIEVFAVAVGLAFLALLTYVSLRGSNGGSRRLPGNRGPIIPVGDHHADDGDADGGDGS